MNDESMKMGGMISDQYTSTMAGIAVANPALYVLMKYWKLFLMLFLSLLVGGLSFAGWKYYQYMNAKLLEVQQQLVEQTIRSNLLSDAMKNMAEDVEFAKKQSNNFNTRIAELSKSNNELRVKILFDSNKPVNELNVDLKKIQQDINNRWKELGSE